MWVKEVGKSEGRIVTIWIEVQTLPHTKVGRLPTGVSSREFWTNNVYVGKQMTAEISLAGAPTSGNASLPPYRGLFNKRVIRGNGYLSKMGVSEKQRFPDTLVLATYACGGALIHPH